MSEPKITKDGLRALAEMQGLTLDDAALDELLPQAQATAETLAALADLEPESAEPASVFIPRG